MADARQVLLQGRCELAFGALRVIDVVLHEGVVGADLVEDGDGLIGPVQVEAGDVIGVDRLDQQAQVVLLQLAGGKAQVLDEGATQIALGDAGRLLAGEAVELTDAERLGVFDRTTHAFPKFVGSLRIARDAAIACVPVACGQVVQHELQAVLVEPRLDLLASNG